MVNRFVLSGKDPLNETRPVKLDHPPSYPLVEVLTTVSTDSEQYRLFSSSRECPKLFQESGVLSQLVSLGGGERDVS